jgi:hypothetical protein
MSPTQRGHRTGRPTRVALPVSCGNGALIVAARTGVFGRATTTHAFKRYRMAHLVGQSLVAGGSENDFPALVVLAADILEQRGSIGEECCAPLDAPSNLLLEIGTSPKQPVWQRKERERLLPQICRWVHSRPAKLLGSFSRHSASDYRCERPGGSAFIGRARPWLAKAPGPFRPIAAVLTPVACFTPARTEPGNPLPG